MKSIIMLEVNELPKRLIMDHVKRRPDGALAKVLSKSRTYETICEDEIELDPWISWPTLHRGVIDKDHHVMHLGQSLDWADKNYPPIWQILQKSDIKVGVFGSLHSSNLPENVEDYCFYMPDYFAKEAFAHPKEMLPFQEFNLVMTRRSARNIDQGLPLKETLAFGANALVNGLTFSTMTQIATQLAQERVEKTKKIRRRNTQAVVGLDLFTTLLDRTKPQFATYYTNHVAAAMHRYWAAYFTDDYQPENPMSKEWIDTYKEELPHSMDVLDEMIAKLVRKVESKPDTVLMIASSLGQAAVQNTGETKGFTTITNVDRLMRTLGLEAGDYTVNNAMVPCVSVDLKPEVAEQVVERLSMLEVMGSTPVRSEREIGPLSFDLKNGKSLHLYFYFEGQEPAGDVRLGNQTVNIADAGFGFFVHEDNVACSAHHIAEGFLSIYDPQKPVKASGEWAKISTRDIAPAILKHFGVSSPAYMVPEPAVALA